MDFITAADPEVGRAIQAEYDRQQQNIELIASENVVSSAVLAAAETVSPYWLSCWYEDRKSVVPA